MRAVLVLGLFASTAYADVGAGASIGAGAQGSSTYSSLELRLDGSWKRVRIGLGARAVWDGAERREMASVENAVAIVRALEASTEWGDTTLALAAGALAPARVGRVADGYRVALDDRWRTGVRAAARSEALDAGIEIDDVIDPVMIAASAEYVMAEPWGMHGSIAIDPAAPAMRGPQSVSVVEAGAHRIYEGERAKAKLGVSVVAEIALGASAVAFGEGAIERGGVTWTARGDMRLGTGSVGSLFGPLYRVERSTLWDRARASELSGAAAGLAIGARADAGWLDLGVRARPGLGGLLVAGAGAPMGRWIQGGVWAAISRDEGAGAAEVRVAWANRLFSALQAARIYRFEMDPIAVWSLTAWFGISSE